MNQVGCSMERWKTCREVALEERSLRPPPVVESIILQSLIFMSAIRIIEQLLRLSVLTVFWADWEALITLKVFADFHRKRGEVLLWCVFCPPNVLGQLIRHLEDSWTCFGSALASTDASRMSSICYPLSLSSDCPPLASEWGGSRLWRRFRRESWGRGRQEMLDGTSQGQITMASRGRRMKETRWQQSDSKECSQVTSAPTRPMVISTCTFLVVVNAWIDILHSRWAPPLLSSTCSIFFF